MQSHAQPFQWGPSARDATLLGEDDGGDDGGRKWNAEGTVTGGGLVGLEKGGACGSGGKRSRELIRQGSHYGLTRIQTANGPRVLGTFLGVK